MPQNWSCTKYPGITAWHGRCAPLAASHVCPARPTRRACRAAEQPKAAGSSLLARLTHLLAAHALELAGMREVGAALVVPLATGMAITSVLLALRGTLPPTAR